MTITTLPAAPAVTDSPSDFNTKAFALVGALATFVTEANALGASVTALEGTAFDYATTAETKASEALGSANTATTKAGEALASAALAQTYATALKSTSTSSLLIEVAPKTFVTQADKQFAAGQFVTAASDANNSNYMHGQVTSYAGTSLVCNMLDVGGTGTYADWTITVSGSQGAKGDKGDAGIGSGDMLLGTAQTVTETKAFVSGKLQVKGSSTGVTAIASANASATGYTITLPAATGTVRLTTDTVTPNYGGTGITSYSVGAILYASASGTLSVLGAVAAGNSLISGGLATAPSWGKIGLTTHISGTLAVGNGGTGATTLTGLVKGSGTGAFTAAVSGVDYISPGEALGTPSGGNLQNCTADGTYRVGYRGIPQNSKSADYTLVPLDSGKHILHPSTDTTARTFTIPSNAAVPYVIGTELTFINQNAAGVVTIAITTDVMRRAGYGTVGSRTLAANGVATAIKVTSTEWIISGEGLT
jgi:hypothetical protein